MRSKHSIPLMGKIVCLFFVVIFLGCIVISMLTYNGEYGQAFDTLRGQTMLMLRTIAQDAGVRAAQTEIVVHELAFNKQIIALFREHNTERYMVQLLFAVQEDVKNSESHLNSLNADILLIQENEALPESYELVVRASRLAEDAYYQAFCRSDALEGWGPAAPAMPISSTSEMVIPYYRKVRFGMSTTIGVIRCSLSASRLFQSLEDWNPAVRVIRQGKEIWRIGDPLWPMPQQIQEESWVENGMLYVAIPVDKLGVTLLAAEALSPLTDRVRQKALVNMGVVFLIGSILLLLTTALVKRMMQRLKQMTQAVSALPENGDLNAIILPEAGEDEAGKLAQAFGNLIGRIDGYYTQLLEEEKAKRQAQQLALQYQINPHFLFNSLYWLQLQMEEQGMDKALSESVSQLGQVLHHNLKGNIHTTLGEEEQMAKAYVHSMGSIKGNEILLRVVLPEELRNSRIPCFCLQPLLENAIQHGMIAGTPLHLRILCEADETAGALRITVENDGKPIAPEQLAALRARLSNARALMQQESGGIGIVNIQCRLELIYGRDASLTIESADNVTRFRLTLPLEQTQTPEVNA